MFKRNELLAFGLAVVLLLSLLTFKAFVPMGTRVGVVQDGMLVKAAESTHFTNLDVVEDFSVGDDATVTGDLLVSGSLTAQAGGGAVGVWTLNATDAVTVGKTLAVVGSSILTGNVNIPGILSSDTINILRLNENTLVTGTLDVNGLATLGTANVSGAFQGGSTGLLNGTLTANAAVITDTLGVSGISTLTGNVNMPGILSSDTLNMVRINENTLVTGTLGVSSLATLGTANVSGAFQGGSTGLFNGALTAASLTLSGTWTQAGQLVAANGLQVTRGITGTDATGTLTFGAGVISSTLTANTFETTDAMTVGGTLRSVGVAYLASGVLTGTLSDVGTVLKLNDNTVVTGTLTASGDADLNGALDVAGIVSSADNDFRLNDNALISGTLTASGAADLNGALGVAGVATFESEAYASNGLRITGNITQVSGSAIFNSASVTSTLAANTLSATDNITTSKSLTATYYGGFGASYFAISSTVDYTTGQTIVLSAVPKGIVPITAGGPTATLDAGASISDGAYLGQILIISNVDGTAGHTLVIKNAANTSIGKDRTLDVNDSIGLYWDGTNWVLMWLTDSSA